VLHVLELAAAGDSAEDIPMLAEAEVEGMPGDRRTAKRCLRWLRRHATGELGDIVRGGEMVPYRLVGTVVMGFQLWEELAGVEVAQVEETVMA